MGQIGHKSPPYPYRGSFLKNWLLFLSTSDTSSQYYNDKKIMKRDHQIQGCIIFGQIGQRHFFFCSIILKCLNLKKKNPYRESWDTRFCDFGPNWDQIPEFSLLEQGIRTSPALAKYFLILNLTTRAIIAPTVKYVRYVTGKSYHEKIVEILFKKFGEKLWLHVFLQHPLLKSRW